MRTGTVSTLRTVQTRRRDQRARHKAKSVRAGRVMRRPRAASSRRVFVGECGTGRVTARVGVCYAFILHICTLYTIICPVSAPLPSYAPGSHHPSELATRQTLQASVLRVPATRPFRRPRPPPGLALHHARRHYLHVEMWQTTQPSKKGHTRTTCVHVRMKIV